MIEKILNKFGYEKKKYHIKEFLYFKEFHNSINPKIVLSDLRIDSFSHMSEYHRKRILNEDLFEKISNYIEYEELSNPYPLYNILRAKLIIGEKTN